MQNSAVKLTKLCEAQKVKRGATTCLHKMATAAYLEMKKMEKKPRMPFYFQMNKQSKNLPNYVTQNMIHIQITHKQDKKVSTLLTKPQIN